MRIRTLTADDIAAGMRLKEQAGWNQTWADWQRVLALSPSGCFVAELDGQTIGTVATTRFARSAWISLMLVAPEYRGRGIGRALMQHALDALDGQGVASIRLDATDLGRPLYEKLGFVGQFTLDRYAGTVAPTEAAPRQRATVVPYRPSQRAELLALDTRGAGDRRDEFIGRLLAEHPHDTHVALIDNRLAGYMTVRPGSRATFVGPCIAAPEAGGDLLAEGLRRQSGRAVYIDVPREHTAAVALAVACGLAPQRALYRMTRGAEVHEDLPWLWASSGPEKG